MYSYNQNIIIRSTPETVFSYMDHLGNTGMHMMKSSSMMLGSKLQLDQQSSIATGLGAKFRWHGKMMGLKMDFTVVVTKYICNVEKTWETIGEARMIILSWYRMYLLVSPIGGNTKAELSIEYTLPNNVFMKMLSLIVAPVYAKWCLSKMLADTKKALE